MPLRRGGLQRPTPRCSGTPTPCTARGRRDAADPADARRTGAGYGLGLETTPLPGGGFYWHHGGNALGFASENGITVDGSRSVTVVVNSFDEADEADEVTQEETDKAVKALIAGALTRED